jgi:DNA-binding MurR/RpiR family transcriptional regulator
MPKSESGQDRPTHRYVAEEIRRTMGDLPATERRVARALLTHYPAAGLEPAVKLAERAGASAPTVTRYIARLGFAGYREFQQALRDELVARSASPMTQPSLYAADTPAARLLADAASTSGTLLATGFGNLPPSEFQQAVDLLVSPRLRVLSVGGRFSRLLADFLDVHLRMLRGQTRTMSVEPDEAALALVELGRRDVLVVFDFRRYQRDVVDFARRAHERNCKVVLITDLWLSPIAEFADVILPLHTENGSPFDSLVPAAVLVETLAAAVLARLGEEAQSRMRLLDQALGGPPRPDRPSW